MKPVRAALWWIRTLMGDHDYQRFVDHRRRTHPGEPIPSEREYWRSRYADADRSPSARCC